MRTFFGVIGYIEWILGTVFLTVIGTILSLKDLSGWSQIVLIVALYVFLIVTTIKRFDEWLNKPKLGSSNK